MRIHSVLFFQPVLFEIVPKTSIKILHETV